jgi:hypothetical protein
MASHPTHKRDIEALVRRAADHELRARLAKGSAERDQCTWLAKKYREKAAWLERLDALPRPPDASVH